MPARTMFVAAALALVASPHAFAQSTSVQAQSLFDEGRALIKAGKVAEACTAFESSQKLDPAVTTLLNLAECREQNRQLATAWGLFLDANRMARASNNEKLARVATNHARKLEPRLSKLTIAVPAERQVAGLEVLRDKEALNPASWNHALPVDGGTYTITARAPGHAPWTASRTIKVEGDLIVVDVPRLAEAAASPVATARTEPTRPGPASPAPAARPVPPPTAVAVRPPERIDVAQRPPSEPKPAAAVEPADQPHGGRSLVVPLAFGGAAVALGAAGIVFEVKGKNLYDQAKDITDPARQPERDSKESSSNSRHKVAQGLGIAALGCAGAAVYFLVRDRGEDRARATAIVPIVAPELAGLAVSGAW
jgi:hypothetical protein